MAKRRNPGEELLLIRSLFALDGEQVFRLRDGSHVLGCRQQDYTQVNARVSGRLIAFRLHRIKFALAYGWLPDEIDHKDADPHNNTLSNLRPCTSSQNKFNCRHKRRARPQGSGLRNVEQLPSGRFSARVRHGNHSVRLGVFDTPEAAKAAAENFKRETRGDFYTQYYRRAQGG